MQITLFIAALLALGVFLFLFPLARRNAAMAEVDDADFFRARIQEIERDVERGVIDPKDAAEAKIEAGRALLNAEARLTPVVSQISLRNRRAAALLVILLIPAISLGLYYRFGTPALYDRPLAARMDEMRDGANIDAMIAKVEKRLEDKPDDGLGWATIAPIYADLGRYNDAIKAYQNAIQYQGENADLRSGLGEARLALAGGVVTVDARADFDRALSFDPKNLRALFYQAAAIEQDGKKDEAIAAYRSLLQLLEADSDAAALVNRRLAALEGAPEQPNFAADDQQAAMIRSMVERLDQRLSSDGTDAEGWTRLMRAYQVMGENEKAKQAVERARKALVGNADGLKTIDAAARELGLQ